MARDILKKTIRDKANASGDDLQENFDAFEARFPLAPEDIEGVNSSTIIWNTPVPDEALTYIFGDGSTGDGINPGGPADTSYAAGKLAFNTLYTNAFKMAMVRDWHNNALLENGKRDIGWVAPCTWLGKRAFAVCDGFNDRVYIVTPSGGSRNLTPQKLAEFEVGDSPQHAIALANGDIYVLCNGTNLSTADASIWRCSPSGSEEYITSSALDTADGISGFRKGAVNMNGSFLYAIAANKTNAFYDRYIQVDLVRKVITSSGAFDFDSANPPTGGQANTANEELVDILVYYPDGRSANSNDAWVVVAQENIIDVGGYGSLWAIKADDGADAYAFPNIATGADGVCRYLTVVDLKCLVQYQTAIVLVADSSGTASDVYYLTLDVEAQEGTSTTNVGWTQLLNTGTAGSSPMIGSACSTDLGIYWIEDDGKVVYQMAGDAQARRFDPRAGWNATPDDKSGIAFDGRTLLIQATDTAADGESVFMRPF